MAGTLTPVLRRAALPLVIAVFAAYPLLTAEDAARQCRDAAGGLFMLSHTLLLSVCAACASFRIAMT